MDEILLKINHLYYFLGGHLKKAKKASGRNYTKLEICLSSDPKKIPRKCTKSSLSNA
jgi:hypothetical protein